MFVFLVYFSYQATEQKCQLFFSAQPQTRAPTDIFFWEIPFPYPDGSLQ